MAENLDRKQGANKAIYTAPIELIAEVERLQPQHSNGKPEPSQDENDKAEFRIKRIDALYTQYGNDSKTWPHWAQETLERLDAAQTEYEAKYC
jgi:hypothetical protein